jgi:hypothetical protein
MADMRRFGPLGCFSSGGLISLVRVRRGRDDFSHIRTGASLWFCVAFQKPVQQGADIEENSKGNELSMSSASTMSVSAIIFGGSCEAQPRRRLTRCSRRKPIGSAMPIGTSGQARRLAVGMAFVSVLVEMKVQGDRRLVQPVLTQSWMCATSGYTRMG